MVQEYVGSCCCHAGLQLVAYKAKLLGKECCKAPKGIIVKGGLFLQGLAKVGNWKGLIRFQHLTWTLITELQDPYFLARIDRDFIAKGAKYHLKYQSSLKNRYRSHVRKLSQETGKDLYQCHGRHPQQWLSNGCGQSTNSKQFISKTSQCNNI